jgi:hypothetical protein
MITFTSSSASLGIEGSIINVLLGDRVSRGRYQRQASFWFFLMLESLREMSEQFLLLRLWQRIDGSFDLRKRVHKQRLALTGRGHQPFV